MNAIVNRYDKNPILTKADVPYPVETVHNAGAVKHEGRYFLVFRSHRRNGRSILGLAQSDDGFRFRVRAEPFMVPAHDGGCAEYEEYGVEDCRISLVEGAYLLTYVTLATAPRGLPWWYASSRRWQSTHVASPCILSVKRMLDLIGDVPILV